jgi:two-component system response regulator PilR (NtrC family)
MGIELLAEVRAQRRAERCVVITAYGSAESAVGSFKAGAFDYLTKPVDLKQFRSVIASAVQDAPQRNAPSRQGAPNRRADIPARNPSGQDAMARLAGESAAMRGLKERIVKVARSMAPVLIRGESGTGKELIACALHANSHRASGPWVAVNCSAIPENLLETEFFGAKKGAYTGATQDREGFFQAAKGGTLFLDEIGDLPLAMQSKLLRAIQERCVRPIGSSQEEPVDVRIVSATHKNLPDEVQSGSFRQDLFYRLNVIDLVVPPLRERTEDLPALCEALLERIAAEVGMPAPRLSAQTMAQLTLHPLRGNVRELENLLHRAVAMGDGDALHVDFNAGFDATEPTPLAEMSRPAAAVPSDEIPSDLQAFLDQQERDILVKVLQETGFNRTATAQRLGLSLRQIRYRIERLNIATPQDNEPQDP